MPSLIIKCHLFRSIMGPEGNVNIKKSPVKQPVNSPNAHRPTPIPMPSFTNPGSSSISVRPPGTQPVLIRPQQAPRGTIPSPMGASHLMTNRGPRISGQVSFQSIKAAKYSWFPNFWISVNSTTVVMLLLRSSLLHLESRAVVPIFVTR